MNFAKLSLLLMLVFSIAACGDDDEDTMMTCTQADWVGTYTGMEICDGDVADANVIITASGTDAIVIVVEDPGFGTATYDPIVPDGCSIDVSGMDQGVTLTLTATLIDDVVTLNSTISDGTISNTCIATATRD